MRSWPQKSPRSSPAADTGWAPPLGLFAEGIKVLLGKPPWCSDNRLRSQL